jgi:hypothetical protein
MCKNCYHAKGRTKKAYLCKHNERTLYAKGVCKNCYLSSYHRVKRVTTSSDRKDSLDEDSIMKEASLQNELHNESALEKNF